MNRKIQILGTGCPKCTKLAENAEAAARREADVKQQAMRQFATEFNVPRTGWFDRIMETAGLYNTVGFNDDTRAFCSIPVRHDVWRRAACDWLAGLVAGNIIGRADAQETAHDLAYRLPKRAYGF